jgi:hypothetical protein
MLARSQSVDSDDFGQGSGADCSEAEEEESIYSEEESGSEAARMYQQLMVGEVARGLSLFGGACSEVRRCNCSVVVNMRASFLPEIYLSIHLRRDDLSVRCAGTERSFLERRGAAELQMRRSALMTRAQASPESIVVDVRPAQAQPRWARARRVTLWSWRLLTRRRSCAAWSWRTIYIYTKARGKT